ncbi:MAG: hypothetical protein Q9213_005545 [Squamulea squamosa]
MSSSTCIDKPTSVEGLQRYLRAKNVEYSNIEQIEGGTANYLFRVWSSSGVPTIYKHAEPYIASSNGAIPFPVERMDFEVTALTRVTAEVRGYPFVLLPKVLDHDKNTNVLVMSDGGKRTLKETYSTPGLDIRGIGGLLGDWLACLHGETSDLSIGEGGNQTAKSIYRWSYSHLASVAAQYELDVEFCEYIDKKYGSSLQTDDECVCHGDFWPGNIMISEGKLRLTVIDWEMCRRGTSATDVAQFAAEAYLLDRFRGGKGLLNTFLRSYGYIRAGYGLDVSTNPQFVQRVAVHLGVHLAFWPASVKWAEKDETKAVVELGHEVIRRADAGDFDWLRGNILGSLFDVSKKSS